MKKRRLTLKQKQGMKGYLFILPWLLGFLFFFVTPVFQTLQFSFSELELSSTGFITHSVGWENYRNAFFSDASFPRLLLESVVQIFTNVPIILVFSFFAATLLKSHFPCIGAVKTIFFLTVVLSSGVFMRMQADTMSSNSAQVTAAMSGGIEMLEGFDIKQYLGDIGLSENVVSYINSYVTDIFAIIARSGIQIFIFLAGLSSISPSIYEACYMEGASGWETFWKITFPMVSPLILVNIVYTIIDFFTSHLNATINYITSQAFESLHYGYSSALSWIYFLTISGILGLIAWLISKRIFYQN